MDSRFFPSPEPPNEHEPCSTFCPGHYTSPWFWMRASYYTPNTHSNLFLQGLGASSSGARHYQNAQTKPLDDFHLLSPLLATAAGHRTTQGPLPGSTLPHGPDRGRLAIHKGLPQFNTVIAWHPPHASPHTHVPVLCHQLTYSQDIWAFTENAV